MLYVKIYLKNQYYKNNSAQCQNTGQENMMSNSLTRKDNLTATENAVQLTGLMFWGKSFKMIGGMTKIQS